MCQSETPAQPLESKSDYNTNNFRFNNKADSIKKSQSDARKLCEDNGGMLYEPMSNDFENDDKYTAIVEKWFEVQGKKAQGWLGIMDNTPNDALANDWVYSASGGELTTFFWKKGQPKDGKGNCIVISKQKEGRWINKECSNIQGFICEFAPIASCTAPGDVNDPNDPKRCCQEDVVNTGQCKTGS